MADEYVIFNHFEEEAERIDRQVNQTVRAAAFHIEAGAKQRAPVDTGFLRNSIYVRTEDSSDNRVSGQRAFPEISAPAHNEAIIAVGAAYGIFQEFGWSHGAAQPYLTPAAEAARAPFLQALKRIEGLGE